MATVEMSFTALPAHVRTARLVATAVARRSGVEEALLDEVRLAVGEACSRAVETHRENCPDEPVRIALTGNEGRFEVVVTEAAALRDGETAGPGGQAAGQQAPGEQAGDAAGHRFPAGLDDDLAGLSPVMPSELGLAVIAGLADDVQITRTGDGLSIRMTWPSAPPPG